MFILVCLIRLTSVFMKQFNDRENCIFSWKPCKNIRIAETLMSLHLIHVRLRYTKETLVYPAHKHEYNLRIKNTDEIYPFNRQ